MIIDLNDIRIKVDKVLAVNDLPKKYKIVNKAFSKKERTLKFYKEELENYPLLVIVFGDYNKGYKETIYNDAINICWSKYIIEKAEFKNDCYFLKEEDFEIIIDLETLPFTSVKVDELPKPTIEKEVDHIQPNHYKTEANIDVIDFCEMYGLDFSLGNVIKYVCRAGKKDNNSTKQDLLKAKEYLERKLKTL
jgi:hypothetical protein